MVLKSSPVLQTLYSTATSEVFASV